MYKEIFTLRLKKAREENQMTQEELSNLLRVSRTTYTNWELGNREPDIEMIGKICEVLKINTNWLIGTDNKEKKSN